MVEALVLIAIILALIIALCSVLGFVLMFGAISKSVLDALMEINKPRFPHDCHRMTDEFCDCHALELRRAPRERG